MLPNRIKLSKKAEDTLGLIQGRTGLRPNALARLAIAHALEMGSLKNGVSSKQDGVKDALATSTLLGDDAEVYAMLIRQQVKECDLGKVVAQLVDDGLGLFSGVNNLSDLFVKCKGKVE